MDKLKLVIPAGWSARLEGQTILIQRRQPVHAACFINAPPKIQGETEEQYFLRISVPGEYQIALRYAPLVTFEELTRLTAENQELSKQLQQLYDSLSRRHMTQKFDSFIPKNAEDERLVDQYKTLKTKLHVLPNLTDGKYSIYMKADDDQEVPGTGWFFLERDCADVKKAVLSLYRPATESGQK